MLVALEHHYLWRVKHCHDDDGCDEVLSIRRTGSQSGRALHFRPGSGFLIPDGGTSASGVVRDDAGRWLILNEPGVVRTVVDTLTGSQWPTADRMFVHLDGWDWFDRVHRRHAAAESAVVSGGGGGAGARGGPGDRWTRP